MNSFCCFIAKLGFLSFTMLTLNSCASAAEHPQPQFMRESWQSLNGAWKFSFDDKNTGLQNNWQKNGLPGSRSIQVPFPFESTLSGIHDTTEHPYSWYEKSFTTPQAWPNEKIILHFGAVHYKTTVWLNGKWIGEHTGGQTPFSFEILNLPAGANKLILRCEHPPENRLIARGKQTTKPKSESIFYTRSSGIWQSVWIESVGQNYLDAVHFNTNNAGNGSAQIQLHGRAAEQQIKLAVQEPSGKSWEKMVALPNGATEITIPFQILNPELWAPNHAKLYYVKMELLGAHNQSLDQVNSYFGIRDVHIANGRVVLNGEPIYLKFILDQGFWPDGIWSPPSSDALVKDIENTLAMGFNGVRKHQKMEDPRFLYWADRMGLLVSSEFASPLDFSPDSAKQFAKEWQEGMLRDWNHPSIIMWVPANESWGYPQLAKKEQHEALSNVYAQTKLIDPTRLAIDNDGWEHTSDTDLFALHDYAKLGSMLLNQFNDFQADRDPPIVLPGVPSSMIPGFRYNGAPIYLSEFGGVGYVLPGDTVPSVIWGYQGLAKTGAEALGRLQDLYGAIAKLPNIIGICLTQLTDVEQEVNGLYTYHRVPKYDVNEIKKLNDLLH